MTPWQSIPKKRRRLLAALDTNPVRMMIRVQSLMRVITSLPTHEVRSTHLTSAGWRANQKHEEGAG